MDPNAVTAWTVLQVPGSVVQRGTQTFPSTTLTLDVPINAVDRGRTFALVTTSSPLAAVDDDERTSVMIELTTDTNVRLTRGSTGEEVTADFQVIQLPATTVQSGVRSVAADVSTASATLTTVDTSRSFVVHSTSIGADVDGAEALYITRADLAANSVSFSRQAIGEPLQISWFAVEIPVGSTVKTNEFQSTAPHAELVFEIDDLSFHEGMVSFTSVEIDSGIQRTSLNAADFTSEVREGGQRLARPVSDGNPVFIRSTVVDFVMPASP